MGPPLQKINYLYDRNLVLNPVGRKEFLVQLQAKAGACTGETPVPPVLWRLGLEPGKMTSWFPTLDRQRQNLSDRDLTHFIHELFKKDDNAMIYLIKLRSPKKQSVFCTGWKACATRFFAAW
jgi:hypothetical protein